MPEREGPVERIRDPVRGEHLVHDGFAGRGVAKDDRDLPGGGAGAEQREHLGADELDLRTLAAGAQEEHRPARVDALPGGLEQPALEVVEDPWCETVGRGTGRGLPGGDALRRH